MGCREGDVASSGSWLGLFVLLKRRSDIILDQVIAVRGSVQAVGVAPRDRAPRLVYRNCTLIVNAGGPSQAERRWTVSMPPTDVTTTIEGNPGLRI